MIKKIKIVNKATIKDLDMEPYKINYIFGGNGSGKSTISNFLNDPINLSTENIVNDSDSEILVYNKAFVDSNFRDKNAIHGIFTIGESAVDAISFIEEKENEKREIDLKIQQYDKCIKQIQEEIDSLVSEHEQNCWLIEKRIDKSFTKALTGYRGSVKVFEKKCRESYTGVFFDCDQISLQSTYNQIYQEDVKEYSKIEKLEFDLSEMEKAPLLAISIVNSSESNFSIFIERMGNMNWVSQGLNYLNTDNICPFCQQIMPSSNFSELQKLFDDTFNQSLAQLESIKNAYSQEKAAIVSFFKSLKNTLDSIPFITFQDVEPLEKDLLLTLDKNLIALENKIKNPASPCELEKTADKIEQLNLIIENYNVAIDNNNSLAKNISQARTDFCNKLWNFISNNLLYSVNADFEKNIKGKNAGMANVMGFRKAKQIESENCDSLIKQKRAGIVSIEHAIDEINSILLGFGFTGFKIEKKDELSYRLIRPDGSEVKETLSEGEHRFITFLYYYQLVKGTLDKESTNKNKILVIDDPISSLDSNILFIVSFLVRNLIDNCLHESNIEQIFILTHNIYFHQEVCFKGRRNNLCKTKERFWVLRKSNEVTTVSEFEENQIKSSYELLWSDFKNPLTDSALICNTMRRILEHYFNVIGNNDYSKLIDQFEGEEKLLCKSLLPYINTGSHIINDDFHLSIDKDMVEKYKTIFKRIFELTNQIQHYNMMMGLE